MSRFYRKIGSWLGLFAILMATLAPTISHTLAMRSHAETMSSEHGDMHSMLSMHSMDAMHDDAPQAASVTSGASQESGGTSTHHSMLSSGDDCGYCSLLAHMPVMPSIGGLFAVTVRALQHTVATRFESVRRVEPLTFAQPRAPPFSS